MADGMTNGEIEDVLSSIRRLVSDGNRPMFRAAPRPFAREAGKLILTPAQRVPPNADTPPEGAAPEEPAPADPAPPPTRLSLSNPMSPARPPLGAVVTAIAAAVPPHSAGWEPETGDRADPFEAGPPRAPDWADPANAWLADAAARLAHPAPQDAEPAPPTDAPSADPDDDLDGDDGWEIHARDPFAATADGDTPAPESPALIDDTLLDARIRAVLLEELRGPLGERITGNLRKLVRAEVARALALRGEV